MKFSYNWLKELSRTKKSSEQVAELLMMHSFEVESIEKTGQNLEGIVVGKILEIRKHPNADKLQLVRVDIGSKKLDIVCGAWNIKIGDIVPVATVGTKLPNGLVIREAEIRGAKSFGMLCAEDEVGLGTDHSGILILDPSVKAGMDFKKYLGSADSVLEIKVLADRSHDALAHIGMAREIAAIDSTKIDYAYDDLKLATKKTKKVAVEIQDKQLCPRYIAAVVENIQVKASPLWLQARLKSCGLRSINNIVDATNYVMLELGQPLHAFDLDKLITDNLQPATIIVRRAKNDEEIILLGGGVKKLTGENLVIASDQKVLAIAGVMGGVDSGINENTKTVVLESANFNAVSVRQTRMALGIKTDASDRFEKDIDQNLAEKAMVRAIEIIKHIAGGELEGAIDVYPKKVLPWKIKLDLNYVNRLLGENIPRNTVIKILKSLGLRATGSGSQTMVVVPTFRLDLRTPEDLTEEIGRIYGYEEIKSIAPVEKVAAAKLNEESALERKGKNILAGLGFDEVYNYSFYGEKDAANAGLGGIKHLELQNPMNPKQKYLRISLIPNVLKNINENLKHFGEMQIFESGRVYLESDKELPDEKKMFVMAVVLEREGINAETFSTLQGLMQAFLSKLGMGEVSYSIHRSERLWHPGRSAEIKTITGEKIGIIGEINPLVLAALKIKKRVAIAEFYLEKLQGVIPNDLTYRKIRIYPVVIRDLSLFADEKVKWEDIAELILKIDRQLVFKVELFDTHYGDKTSYAFHIHFGTDRTLEGKEVDEVMQKIILALEKNPGCSIRK